MSESEQQGIVISWAKWNEGRWPCLKWLYHCPNGGSRDKREAARLKWQGVKAGVSDLFLPYPSNGFHGLYIEMKAGKNKPTPEQKEFLAYAEQAGYQTHICYSADEAIDKIERYLR